MKMRLPRVWRRKVSRGLSLMEVTLAMTMTMIIGTASVTMIAQEVSFMSLMRAFSFLRDEAPIVNSLVVRLFSQAESYRIYGSKSAAFSGGTSINTGGKAVWLSFRNPDGTTQQAVVAFEGTGANVALNYYHRTTSGWGSSPNWTITSRPSNVTFADDTGVLLITLTGPAGEQLTYVATGE